MLEVLCKLCRLYATAALHMLEPTLLHMLELQPTLLHMLEPTLLHMLQL